MTPVRVPVYRAAQVRAAERPLLEAGDPLMRRAAAALSRVAREEVENLDAPTVLVLAGSGDNGGDALYAAADLASVAAIDILTLGTRVHEDALASALVAGARRIESLDQAAAFGYDLVLDGILGIGAVVGSGLREPARGAVERLLPQVRDRARVIAVDLPSGLDPDTGAAVDPVLPATVTVTFGAVKSGLVAGRGPELCGRIVLVDLGLGPELDVLGQAGEASVSRVIPAQTA